MKKVLAIMIASVLFFWAQPSEAQPSPLLAPWTALDKLHALLHLR